MTSIHDVARQAGVSTATVSRALRGVDRVSTSTRERVLVAAAELHYVASPTAAGLATGRTGVVGVLAPFSCRWFFAQALAGIERELRPHRLHVMLFNLGERPAADGQLRNLELLHKRLDALLVLSCDLRPAEVAVLQRLRIPVVTVGVDVGDWDLVRIDDVAAARIATEHLLGLGHRQLGYVGGDLVRDVHLATAVDRAIGLQQAVDAASLPDRSLRHAVGDWTVEGGERAAHALLSHPRPPTAVLAASDEMAIGVLRAARTRGLRVPAQLSVVGIDDHEMSWTHDLTTVAQPVPQQGELAARLLVDRLLTPVTAVATRTVHTFPTPLIVRGTAGPAPASASAKPQQRIDAVSLAG